MTGSVSSSEAGPRPRARRWIVAAVGIGAIIGALLSIFGGDFQRRLVFDSWQNWAPREATSDRVVVVLIDDASVAAKGQWPWRRSDVAALIENIAETGPAAIGIDIFFVEPDPLRPETFASLYTRDAMPEGTREELLTLPYGDQYLAEQIQQAPTVMAWITSDEGGRPLSELTWELVEGDPPPDLVTTSRMLTSIPMLDDVAFARGVVAAPPDRDGITRRVPLAVRAGNETAPGFAVQLANLGSGGDILRWTPDGLQVGERVVPSDSQGRFEFKMGPGWADKVIPALKVLDANIEVADLKDKIVLVGFGATGTSDIVATPVASEMQGTLVQAQAVDAILTGEWLSRPKWVEWLEIGLALALVAILLAAGITFNSLLLVPAAAIGVALPFASFIAYDSANLLFDPARPLIVGLCAAIALLLVRYALTLAELLEKRIFAAEQEKENESARQLQLTMVPSPARLAKLGTRTEIGAVLEPAKSVGGDFYDAMELEGNRLAFLVGDVSGKGLRAALFMALSKSVSKNNLLRASDDLEAAVRTVNEELMAEEDQEMDLTMLVGVIDCATGEVQLVNAGHEDPMIVRADGSVEIFRMVGGLRLRTLDGFPYAVERVQLRQGDTLVIISDGATDASNAKEDRFGLDRVIQALKEVGHTSAAERARHLAERVRMFERGTDPADDLTILALRYLGDGPAESATAP
jgi:serine phosphatase RsbU (regulator of sigma subunit)